MSGDGGGVNVGGIAGAALGPLGSVAGGSLDSALGGTSGLNGLRDIVTGKSAADAQGRIAEAQLAEQRATRAAATGAAAPSLQEMQMLQESIATNNQDIARKQKLLDSSDPALIEAGQQALKLLKGQDAATLSPIKTQRAKERMALQSKLSAQLGPGYENSTAGIQALTAFDQATDMTLANAQQNSLSQLLGVAQNTSGNFGMQSNIGNNENLANLFGNQSSRMVSAINGTPITGAGAQYVSDLQLARGQQGLVNAALQGGAAYMTSGASSATGAAPQIGASPTAGGYSIAPKPGANGYN